ncbi:CRISPR-associated Cmr4 family protein [Nocardiopsis sp. Huas11]|uniref:type III-B CRISPR module RAMP protein Cmr4 n=1 Tax=Nocardiopsis sp. Huas11 TaxID=2183912 RepID=UPI000EACDD72|nr:type III-B CRISPR module RAMP protein Cmr4 [Nocardiopsis sp. Huas11]RKS07009.1 CRISPR-associated Cmr4 family protein [Nocardiopsis sp. Huas11]
MINYLLYLYAESPVHAGASGSDGALDLPIQREVATGYPVVWGQSLKGALRQAARDRGLDDDSFGSQTVNEVFGPPPSQGDEPGVNPQAGLLRVGDAQLVALPVATMQRTFAWATSATALSRLARKYRYAEADRTLPTIPTPNAARGYAGDQVWVGSEHEEQVVGPCLVNFESLVPSPQAKDNNKDESEDKSKDEQESTSEDKGEDRSADPVYQWGELLAQEALGEREALEPFASKLKKDLLVVGEDVMQLLVRQGTEHTVRVQLVPDTKEVKQLFSSEYLPAETVLAAVLTLREHPDRSEEHQILVQELLEDSVLQIGGDETVGKGLVWSKLVEAHQ